MKFTNFITDLSGNPVKQGDKEIMIGECCIAALFANFEDERQLDGNEKLRRFNLAQKIHATMETLNGTIGETADLTAEEIALVKKLIPKMFGPLIVGRVFAEIDPASVPFKRKEKTS